MSLNNNKLNKKKISLKDLISRKKKNSAKENELQDIKDNNTEKINVQKINQNDLEEIFTKNKMLVVLRVRPLLNREIKESNYKTISIIDNNTALVSIPTEYIPNSKGKYYFKGEKNIKVIKVKEATFKFDFALNENTSQADIYQITLQI